MESKRILFFDDESDITKPLIDNLQRNHDWSKNNLGEIVFVSTPEELFKMVNGKTVYDLFVLDIMVSIEKMKSTNLFSDEEIDRMQEGDNSGVVVAEKIRETDIYKTVPILFLSARIRPSEMMENSDYIEKPTFAADISEKMKKMLNI